MTFKAVNLAASAVSLTLALVLIFGPGLIYWLFDLTSAPVGDILAKRAAMLFLGFATLLFLSRTIGPGPARHAICWGLLVAMGGLALLGVFEFFRDTIGPGIWLAILTETGFAASYARILRRDSKPLHYGDQN